MQCMDTPAASIQYLSAAASRWWRALMGHKDTSVNCSSHPTILALVSCIHETRHGIRVMRRKVASAAKCTVHVVVLIFYTAGLIMTEQHTLYRTGMVSESTKRRQPQLIVCWLTEQSLYRNGVVYFSWCRIWKPFPSTSDGVAQGPFFDSQRCLVSHWNTFVCACVCACMCVCVSL